jgi:hypothetical protein
LATQPNLAINHHSIPPQQLGGQGRFFGRMRCVACLDFCPLVPGPSLFRCGGHCGPATCKNPIYTWSSIGRVDDPGQQLGPTSGKFQSFPKRPLTRKVPKYPGGKYPPSSPAGPQSGPPDPMYPGPYLFADFPARMEAWMAFQKSPRQDTVLPYSVPATAPHATTFVGERLEGANSVSTGTETGYSRLATLHIPFNSPPAVGVSGSLWSFLLDSLATLAEPHPESATVWAGLMP